MPRHWSIIGRYQLVLVLVVLLSLVSCKSEYQQYVDREMASGIKQDSLIFGMRGMAYVEIEVRTGSHDLHSGQYGGAVPNPLDIRFQKVSGLEAEVETDSISEGGQNLYTQRLPRGVKYGNLVLTRGMVVGSPLNLEFNATLSLFKFVTSNVMVTLHDGVPVSIELPQRITVEIVEADPVVKGQTASSSYKPAVADNGLRVMVPPHIAAGTRVVIMTDDGSYVERAKD